jgi:ribosome biogenesis GTPase / thiamine phosphate phosphatase
VGDRAPDQMLRDLGWDDALAEAFTVHDNGASWPARISRVDRGGWITAETGTQTLRARQHARSRRARSPLDIPTVGDWVVLDHDPGGGEPIASALLPRRSIFVRNAGDDDRALPQPLAANIDSVLLAVALDVPYNARRTDRLLSLAWASGAEPVMVMTKADTVDDVESALDEVRDHVVGVQVEAISVRTGAGLDGLRRHLAPGRTVVLIGQSGAGKSTLANYLSGDDVLAAAEVRKDGKGRHTTSHRQLLRLPSGALLIDTPGLRSVGLWEAQASLEDAAFGDIDDLAAQCRFSDCAHEQEPGCAVREALAGGTLDPQRWESYRKLREEADQVTRARELAARAQRSGRRRR